MSGILPAWPKVTWESLTGFRTANVLSIGYVGALAVPLIKLAGPTVVSLGKGSETLLALAFLASLALAIAHAANEILCPQLIRSYPSFALFHKAVSEFAQQRKMIETTAQDDKEKRLLSAVAVAYPHLAVADAKALMKAINDETTPLATPLPTVIDTYQEDWLSANAKNPVARYCVATFYGLAAVFGSVLAVRITAAVVRHAGWF